jgi:hypothetical protein
MESIQQEFRTEKDMVFMLPLLWTVHLNESMQDYPAMIPLEITSTIHYSIHHIQYRSCNVIMPYLNVNLTTNLIMNKKPIETKKIVLPMFEIIQFRMDINKPQYRLPTIFKVMADIQFDIYHLFAYGKNNQQVYYNIAYISNYKTSVMMNGLFRNIRENKNIDYIEESDDEDDFQNMDIDKYVNIEKVLLMECIFHQKFKRWVPMRVVNKNEKVIHIGKL